MSELPDGWAISTVAGLVGPDGVFADGDWVESKDQDPNGAIRLLQLADIGDGRFVDKSHRFINDEKFVKLRCTEVLEGDVLIARMPDPLGRACLTPKLKQRCVTVVDVAILRPGKSSVLPAWAMHFINSSDIREFIEREATGSTRKRIARGKLSAMELPVPPLAEQKRIADKLDVLLARVDACRARLDRLPALLKRFRQSVLAAATSGRLTEEWRQKTPEYVETFVDYPYSHTIKGPSQWSPTTFGDVCDLIGGSQPPKSTFTHEELPSVIRLIQIRDYKSDKHLVFIPRKLARRFCSKTDVMIGRYGPPIFQILRGIEGAYNVALMKAQPKDSRFDLNYLYYWLQQDVLLRYVEAGSDRTAGQDGVRKELVEKYPLFLPPLAEQQEIVRRVEELFSFADRIESRLAEARKTVERLTPAILGKAFRGELVPQDPTDEPAAVMLERLRKSSDGPSAPKPKRGRRPNAS